MSVPNTETFSIMDVITELGGGLTSLQACFDNANSSGFSPTYNNDTYAPANSILRFRDYTHGDLWLSFNGSTSQSTYSSAFSVNAGDFDFGIQCTFNLSSLATTVVLFEVSGLVTVFWDSSLNNLVFKLYDRSFSFTGFNSGTITAGTEYTCYFSFVTEGTRTRYKKGLIGSANSSGLIDITIPATTKDIYVGHSILNPAIATYNAYIKEISIQNETSLSGSFTIDASLADGGSYASIDITKVIL